VECVVAGSKRVLACLYYDYEKLSLWVAIKAAYKSKVLIKSKVLMVNMVTIGFSIKTENSCCYLHVLRMTPLFFCVLSFTSSLSLCVLATDLP